MSSVRLALIPLLVAVCVTGCGGGSEPSGPGTQTPAPVASVAISGTTGSLTVGQTAQLSAVTKDANGNVLSGRDIAWSSNAGSVATVGNSGLVTAVAPGSAQITATSEGKTASVTITVSPLPGIGPAGGTVSSTDAKASVTVPAGALGSNVIITVTPVANPQPAASLVPNTAYDFGPTGTTFAQPVTLSIRYDAAVETGRTPSLFRIHKLIGTTWTPVTGSTVNTTTRTVTATTTSFSTYAILQVPAPVATITVTPNNTDLPLGMELQLTAVTRDAQNNVLTGRNVTYSTTSSAVSVSQAGLVTSLALGTANITVASEGVSTNVVITVRGDPSTRTLSLSNSSGYNIRPAGGPLTVVPATFPSACAIGVDRHGYCWGYNSTGAIGDGTRFDRSIPTPISLGASLKVITVGAAFACALDVDNQAWCWGLNGFGNFGNGNTGESLTPVRAGNSMLFTDLAAGNGFVCGIAVNGNTYCWGNNYGGILGVGINATTFGSSITVPTRVSPDPGFVRIFIGTIGTCGLTAQGAVYCWGLYDDRSTLTPSISPVLINGFPPMAQLSPGLTRVCGVSMDRRLFCIGNLGEGMNRTTPLQLGVGTSWRQVTNSLVSFCALSVNSRMSCTGSDMEGSYGNGAITPGTVSTVLTPITGTQSFGVLMNHDGVGCGIVVTGELYCAGRKGLLANGEFGYTVFPTQVTGAQNVTMVARGSMFACYVAATLTPSCWAETEAQTSPGVPSFGTAPVKAIAAGGDFVCAIANADSKVFCVGENSFGINFDEPRHPAAVQQLNATTTFTMLAAGGAGACGISTAQALFCWSIPAATLNPIAVRAGTAFQSIWGGGQFSDVCAITMTQVAFCGSVGSQLTQVPGSLQFTMMAGGFGYYCGIVSGGDAYCWGSNDIGQLGDGSLVNRTQPTLVSGGHKFSAIYASFNGTCALEVQTKLAWCWGNSYTQAAPNGAAVPSNVPVAVPGNLQFDKLSMNYDSFRGVGTCGVTIAATIYCWGSDYQSALGNGVTDDRRTHVQASGGIRFLLYDAASAAVRANRR